MQISATEGVQAGKEAAACAAVGDKPNQMAFDAALSDAEESNAAEGGDASGCMGSTEDAKPLSLAERIDKLEERIAELEQSDNPNTKELAALNQELLSLSNEVSSARPTFDDKGMSMGSGVNDQASADRLNKLQSRLDAL